MEEKKLTDEEIVKALGCCMSSGTCLDCPRNVITCTVLDCRDGLYENALDLIHRLQDENKRMKKQVDESKKDIICLTNYIERLEMDIMDFEYDLSKTKKDTAKEILEMADKINKGGQNDLCELEVAIKKRYGVEVE